MSSADTAAATGLTLSGAPEPAPSPYRWAWYLPGLVAVAWGGYGLLQTTEPLSWALFAALGIAGHDLLLAPIAVGVGWLLARVVPAALRAPVQVGLLGTGIAIVASLPNVLGRGTSADVPSALPFNYAGRVAVLLAVLWVAMAGWALFRLVRSRRNGADSAGVVAGPPGEAAQRVPQPPAGGGMHERPRCSAQPPERQVELLGPDHRRPAATVPNDERAAATDYPPVVDDLADVRRIPPGDPHPVDDP